MQIGDPVVGFGFEAPRVGGLFGVWRIDGSWETETYRSGADSLPTRESRMHGALTVSDWLSGRVRYAMTTSIDAWSTGQRTASVGASIERRWFADRISTAADATVWMPTTHAAAFNAVGTLARFRSSTDDRVWVSETVIGAERVSDGAPMTLWPGAGNGQARAPLLRAHPLLDDGVIDATGGVFGRTVTYGTTEVQRWLAGPAPARVGIAAFIDAARASRRVIPDQRSWQADVGAGLRVRVPGWARTLRLDAAYGLHDGARAIGIGWSF